MANALDYISWRGDLTIDRDPVNEVDLFLFSQLATPDYTGVIRSGEEKTVGEAAKRYLELHKGEETLGVLQSKYILPMLKVIKNAPRFKDLSLCMPWKLLHDDNIEQFEAVSIRLSEKELVVSYRATDDTLTGWKENFYMCLEDTVPAQADALRYLCTVAKAYPDCNLRVVGHSKGGNLAVYAAVMAPEEIRKRIRNVVGFDNPGFLKEFLASQEYREMEGRIVSFRSQNSVIGTIMELAGRSVIAHSLIAGPYAHDGFNWEVCGRFFKKDKELSVFSRCFEKAMEDTLNELPPDKRKEFIDELFAILEEYGAKTLTDLTGQSVKQQLSIMGKIAGRPAVSAFFKRLLAKTEKEGMQLIGTKMKRRKTE